MKSLRRSLTLILTSLLGLILLLSVFEAGRAQNAPLGVDVTGSIAGIVTDSSGRPLPDIDVTAFRDQSGWYQIKTVKTDAAGAFKISYLNTGIYRLRFIDPSEQYLLRFYPNSQNIEDALDIPVVGADVSGLQTVLSPAAQITGTLAMWDGGRPAFPYILAYAQQADGEWQSVKSGVISFYDNPSMSYRIIGLSPGRYRVSAEGSRLENFFSNFYREFYDDAIVFEDASDLLLTEGSVVSGVNFVLGDNPLLSDLSGVVTSPEGEGVPGIEVTALVSKTWGWQEAYQTRTITDGVFTLRSLATGTYALRYRDLNRAEYVTQYYPNAPSLQTATPLSLTAGIDFTDLNAQLMRTGNINAEIVMYDGLPPQEATIGAYSAASGYGQLVASKYEYTDNGQVISITLTGLPPDNYRLYVNARYDDNSFSEYYDDALLMQNATDVAVASGATTKVRAALGDNPGYAQIIGIVQSRQATPVAGIRVTARFQEYPGQYYWSSRQSTYTDELGRYRLWALTPNTYTLQFYDEAGLYRTQFYANVTEQAEATLLRVESGQIITGIDVTLEQTGVLSGTVMLYDGRPPTTASIVLYRQAESDWVFIGSRYLDSRNVSPHYHFAGLATGIYRISVNAWFDGEGYYPTMYYDGADTIETAQDIAVVDGYTTADINFVFGEDQRDARIEGTVSADGVPLPDMRVDLYNDESGYGNWQRLVYIITGADGSFRIDGLRTGSYRICVVDPVQVRATVCYPGASGIDEAATLFLADGQALSDLWIEMAPFDHHTYLPMVGR